jgi:hypothetical protein
VYARKVKGRELSFDFAEGLINDNLLIADRETDSVWSQMEGRAISGPLAGSALPVVPSLQVTWEFWRRRHPQTRVWVEREDGRPYFYRNPQTGSRKGEHDTSALGLGLVLDGEAIYFPFAELKRASRPLEVTVGGRKVKVVYEAEALTAWAEDGAGTLLPGILIYQLGWLSFHPESEIYRADAEP